MVRRLVPALVFAVLLHAGIFALAEMAPEVRAVPQRAGEVVEIEVISEPEGGGPDAAEPVAHAAPAGRPADAAGADAPVGDRAAREQAAAAEAPAAAESAAPEAAVAAEAPSSAEPASAATPQASSSPQERVVAGAGTGPGGPGGGGAAPGAERGTGSGGGSMNGTGRGAGTTKGAWRSALLAHLHRNADRCYPRAARRRRTQGTSEVHFCVDDGGQPREVRLARSSGSRLLDDAAVDCVVRGSAPLPQAPCLTAPIRFSLE